MPSLRKGPRPPKPYSAKGPKPASPNQRRKQSIVIKHGEYFDGPTEEEELRPLDQVALPRSLIEEEEEKDFRKRFNRAADEDVVDIYSAERHAAVTVKDSDLDDDSQRQVGSRGFLVVVAIILLFAFSGAIIFMFRDQLRKPLAKVGITLPR